jgi:hypothetical protein
MSAVAFVDVRGESDIRRILSISGATAANLLWCISGGLVECICEVLLGLEGGDLVGEALPTFSWVC